MQIVVCISMIDFMQSNGEHETGMFALYIYIYSWSEVFILN